MLKYFAVSVFGGLLFGILDGVINANPYASKYFEVYKPIARTSINVPLGFLIDLVYGFVMAGVFLLLYKSLPGETGFIKALSYGLLAWFFRTVMYAASQYMMFEVSLGTIFYILIAGLAEMLVLGLFFGLVLRV